jgi:hypothetical protein
MSKDLESVLGELSALRRANRSQNQSVFIRKQLERNWSQSDAAVLCGELIGEYQTHGQYSDALECLFARVREEPTEPYHSVSLAEHFHYYDVDLQRSLSYIAEAIVKARLDGKFLYQSLGVQARLTIETQRWPLLEETLRELTAYEHKPGNVDVFPETDFIARIPSGMVPQSLVAAYRDRVEYLRSIGYSTLHGPRSRAE